MEIHSGLSPFRIPRRRLNSLKKGAELYSEKLLIPCPVFANRGIKTIILGVKATHIAQNRRLIRFLLGSGSDHPHVLPIRVRFRRTRV
jgi:hypothetical protein